MTPIRKTFMSFKTSRRTDHDFQNSMPLLDERLKTSLLSMAPALNLQTLDVKIQAAYFKISTSACLLTAASA